MSRSCCAGLLLRILTYRIAGDVRRGQPPAANEATASAFVLQVRELTSKCSESMPTEPLIDLEEFLQPVAEDSPAGEDLRADYSPNSAYFELKDAQAAARTDERRRRESFDETMDTDFAIADWKPILESARASLRERTKDLEVAAWHIEAMLRVHGFAGVRDGFRLLGRLADQFWDHVHPRPDEDGLETTVAAVTSLNGGDGPGTLIWPISNIPIVQGKTWGTWKCRQAESLEGMEPEVLEERIAEGAVSPEMLRTAVHATPPDFFRQLLADIDEAIEAVSECEQIFDRRCGEDESGYEVAPGTGNIVQALKDASSAIRSITVGISLEPEPEPEAGAEVLDATDDEGADSQMIGGQALAARADQPLLSGTAGIVQTRDQAFRAIQELADHFKKTEPHSPVAYLLEQAVRWGRLPLPHLLSELVYDQQLKDDLFRLMGMAKPDDDLS